MSYVLPTKTYEKPESGLYHGVLADIVDLGMQTTTFNGQARTVPMIRFVWFLNAIGKDGKQLSVAQRFNASSDHEKSNIFKTLKMILGQAPAKGFDLELLIGQVRKILINRERSADGTKDFANIMGILPADPGAIVAPPVDFIRAKFRPQTTAGPQGQPVQTYQQPPQTQPVATAAAVYTPPPTAPVQQLAPQTYPTPTPQGADIKF